jgi:hypothetical protein
MGGGACALSCLPGLPGRPELLQRPLQRTLGLPPTSSHQRPASSIGARPTLIPSQTVRLLLAAAPDQVGTREDKGRTPLYAAAASGSAGAVRLVLEAPGGAALFGARAADGLAPLHAAAMLLHDAVVGVLLEFGPADARDAKGLTPLMHVGGRYFKSRAPDADGGELSLRPDKAAAVVRRLVAAGGRPLFPRRGN